MNGDDIEPLKPQPDDIAAHAELRELSDRTMADLLASFGMPTELLEGDCSSYNQAKLLDDLWRAKNNPDQP